MQVSENAELVTYEQRGNVVLLGMNRPDKLNAMSDDLVLSMADALHRFDTDETAWVAIIHGHGRAFSSGADVRQRQLRSREELIKLGSPQGRGAHGKDLLANPVNWKPVIAAVHGYAIGMALGLALECEVIVATESTRFQVTEVRRGLAGSRYWALLHFRGAGAFGDELAVTGRFFSAQEALQHNIINKVVPDGQHLEAALEYAAAICENPPLSARTVVRTRRWYMAQAEREAYVFSDPLKLHLTEDMQESARAFAEKRAPNLPWKGR
jgi:enoyl-CoA hydratase/carnithine racemase